MYNIAAVEPINSKSGFQVALEIDGKALEMELDTGASVSLVSQRIWKKKFPGVSLDPSEVQLRTYSGEGLPVLGQKTVKVKYQTQEIQLPSRETDQPCSGGTGCKPFELIGVQLKNFQTPLAPCWLSILKCFKKG